MWEEIERFRAQGESGATYIVVVNQMRPSFTSLSRGRQPVSGGLIEYRLADGRDVSPIDGENAEEFKIFDTEERIWKIA